MAARNHFFGDRENAITIRQFGNWFSVFFLLVFSLLPINDIDFKSVILTRVAREKVPLKSNSIQPDYVCVAFEHKSIDSVFSIVFRFNGTSVNLEIKPTDKLKRRCVWRPIDRHAAYKLARSGHDDIRLDRFSTHLYSWNPFDARLNKLYGVRNASSYRKHRTPRPSSSIVNETMIVLGN